MIRIFEEYVSGKGLFAIAEGLTRDGVLSASAYDRARNAHRNGEAWSKSAVRPQLFEAARVRRAASGRTTIRMPRRTARPYLLRGLLRCGLCQRRMQGSWNHQQAYYRCCYSTEYALPGQLKHPKAVYVARSRSSLRSMTGSRESSSRNGLRRRVGRLPKPRSPLRGQRTA